MKLISLLALVITASILIFIIYYLLRSIKKLTKIVKHIIQSNEYVDISDFGNGYLGRLAKALSLMANDRNKSLEELEQTKELIEKLGDGIITMDSRGTIIGFTQSAADIFGYKVSEIIGENISIFMPLGKHANEHSQYVDSYITIGNNRVIMGNRREVNAINKHGVEFPIGIFVNKMIINNEHVFIAAVRDITVKNKNEEILRKAKKDAESAVLMKTKFLARMSHEIRTPMNGIIGTVSLIKDTNLDEKQKNYIKTIMSSGQSLLLIVNEILDFSSLEVGKIKIIKEPFDIYHTIDEVYHLFQYPIQEKAIAINLKYNIDVPEFIIGDSGRIRQVVINLINNAMKFTNEGSINIEVKQSLINNKDKAIKFLIKDTGIGISKSGEEQLFQAFLQVDSSSVRRTSGTGLGLSIAKALVDLMGGEIGVESIDGKGSTFWFSIPLETPNDKDLAILASKIIKNKNIIEIFNYDAKVLIVEDVEVNRFVIIDMLEGYGCKVESAVNGKIGVKMAAENNYDIIFMDCLMPIMNGFEATKEIRKNNKDIPIVAMTANVLSEEKEKCFNVGMNDFIAKPFTKEVFAPVLNKWLERFIIPNKAIEKKVKEKKILENNILKLFSPKEFDIEAIKQFGANAKKIIELTLIDSDDFMKNIEKAINENNSEDLGLEAHSLKSVAAQIGGMKISELAKVLEFKGKKNDNEDVENIFAELKSKYINFKKILLKYLDSIT